jgi:hypothetical protein
MAQEQRKTFADYKDEGYLWITLAPGQYYPDYLNDASNYFEPILVMFGQLVASSHSSSQLFTRISGVPSPTRNQLQRVFRRYVCPELPVELTKRKRNAESIAAQFESNFRPIQEVHAAFLSRPVRDEAISALLWEHMRRGQSGYDLTGQFFTLFRSLFPDLTITGPIGAGRDVLLGSVFGDTSASGTNYPPYPNPNRPVDFVIYDKDGLDVLAIGLARYDSNRGGAQEDDRIGGYRECATEILTYAKNSELRIKVIFLNDGPGLLAGSMWNDYARIEQLWPGKAVVLTLRMVRDRLTREWLHS